MRLHPFVGRSHLLTELLLHVHLPDGVVDVGPVLLDVVGLIFLQQQREQHVVVQHIGSFEGVPAGGDHGGLVDAGRPVNVLHALRLAFPHRHPSCRLGDIPDRPLGAGNLVVGGGFVPSLHLLAQGLEPRHGIFARSQFANQRCARHATRAELERAHHRRVRRTHAEEHRCRQRRLVSDQVGVARAIHLEADVAAVGLDECRDLRMPCQQLAPVVQEWTPLAVPQRRREAQLVSQPPAVIRVR